MAKTFHYLTLVYHPCKSVKMLKAITAYSAKNSSIILRVSATAVASRSFTTW